MTEINYVTGDATAPPGDGVRFIVHVCNDVGGWGSGFVVALSRRSTIPEACYRSWYRGEEGNGNPFELGQVQGVAFDRPGVVVINMIAQRGIRHDRKAPPAVDYEALGKCLEQVCTLASVMDASVHMPRIGCGLGGGDWNVVEDLIKQNLLIHDVPVTVYDLPAT